MEQNKIELMIIEQISSKVRTEEIQQLTDLQLAFVGGGIGETAV